MLIGRYLVDDSPIPFHLAVRHVRGGEERTPVSFAVEDQGDSTLTVSVRYEEGEDGQAVLRRGNEWAGDYYCDDGWFKVAMDGVSSRWPDLVRPGGHAPKRGSLRIAPGTEGALIAKLVGHWFEGFQPYSPGSGDGIPLPLTWKSAHAWLRTESFSPAALARLRARRPSSIEAQIAAQEAGVSVSEAIANDPVWQANHALEHGPPATGQREASERITAAVPSGLRILVIAPRDSGWHVSVAMTDPARLPHFLSNLAQREDVRAVQHDALTRGMTETGLETTAVYVRFAPTRR